MQRVRSRHGRCTAGGLGNLSHLCDGTWASLGGIRVACFSPAACQTPCRAFVPAAFRPQSWRRCAAAARGWSKPRTWQKWRRWVGAGLGFRWSTWRQRGSEELAAAGRSKQRVWRKWERWVLVAGVLIRRLIDQIGSAESKRWLCTLCRSQPLTCCDCLLCTIGRPPGQCWTRGRCAAATRRLHKHSCSLPCVSH